MDPVTGPSDRFASLLRNSSKGFAPPVSPVDRGVMTGPLGLGAGAGAGVDTGGSSLKKIKK